MKLKCLQGYHRDGALVFLIWLSVYGFFKGWVVVQSLSRVRLFATPWTAARQASLSITNTWSPPNSCPLSQWCHPTISSSVVPFSSCPQSFPASRSFPMSQLFASTTWMSLKNMLSGRRQPQESNSITLNILWSQHTWHSGYSPWPLMESYFNKIALPCDSISIKF